MSRCRLVGAGASLAALVAGLSAAGPARSAEGGLSHYLPGLAGDFGLAIAPKPGLQVANVVWWQSGSIDAAVLQGRVDLGLDADIVLDVPVATYTFDGAILGGVYTAGIAVPFGYGKLDAEATGPLGNTLSVGDDSFALSDIAITPLQLNWNSGNFHFKFAETVIAPTGAYDVDDLVNLGRNYWSFDSIGAITWFDPEIGTELSVAAGVMLNTKNEDTDYQTGVETHVDFTANQFLAPTFALGLRGYYYRQVSGDSGSGALLGDFKSEAFGLGPGFLWSPAFAEGRLAIAGKWLHDFSAENRFKSDYGIVTVGWKF
ncbi:hypothetical protein E3C22_05510 [Jiella endophytica]|uniref:Transporter n=1 Tax=Jiella endophytica TaxID=2558362 RepID=A0A4Y8RP98_9HYPH|nr:transporter [Jiella endophytica]TFF24850.1 hypothetical protein E3C22_05510 [Jiella endophytica]